MSKEVKVPTLGESVTEATIGEWLKQPGDPVKVDEPIVSLETDKVAVEVPSPVAGVMGTQAVEVGANVEVGALLATIEDDVAPGETTKVKPREDAQPAEQAAPAAPAPAPTPTGAKPDNDTLEDAAAFVANLVALHTEPGRRDLAWRYGLDEEVLDPVRRTREIANFIESYVRPERSRRGRA